MKTNNCEYFYPNGNIYYRIYRNAAEVPHRDPSEGPAYECWNNNGNKICENYYIDGKEVPKPEAKVDINMEVKPIEKFHPNGNILSRSYLNASGEYHRDPDEGPALEHWYESGQKACEYYYVEGQLHRDPLKGPSSQTWHKDGKKYICAYFVDGKEVPKPEVKVESKMEVKPKEIFYPSGKIRFREYKNAAGFLHRDSIEGPAYEYWYQNGQKYYQSYCVDGKLHRDPLAGPAYEAWFSNGQKWNQEYIVDGKVLRDPGQGPAQESWYEDGQRKSQTYSANEKLVQKPEDKTEVAKNDSKHTELPKAGQPYIEKEPERFEADAIIAENPATSADKLEAFLKDERPSIRGRVACNLSVSLDILEKLSNDEDWYVRECVAINQKTSFKLLTVLANDKRDDVRKAVAKNLSTPKEILKLLAEDKNRIVRINASVNLSILEHLSLYPETVPVDNSEEKLKESHEANTEKLSIPTDLSKIITHVATVLKKNFTNTVVEPEPSVRLRELLARTNVTKIDCSYDVSDDLADYANFMRLDTVEADSSESERTEIVTDSYVNDGGILETESSIDWKTTISALGVAFMVGVLTNKDRASETEMLQDCKTREVFKNEQTR